MVDAAAAAASPVGSPGRSVPSRGKGNDVFPVSALFRLLNSMASAKEMKTKV